MYSISIKVELRVEQNFGEKEENHKENKENKEEGAKFDKKDRKKWITSNIINFNGI